MKKQIVAASVVLAAVAALAGGISPLTVMTYNIRCAGGDRDSKDNNWLARRVDFANFVKRLNPDVVGFQEVQPEQLDWLKSQLPGYDFVGRGRNAHGGGEASPVAFRRERFKSVAEGTFWLSGTPDVPGSVGWDAAHPRICTYAILIDGKTGKKFSFANTHTDHIGAAARENGMLLVLKKMKAFGKGAPVVFVGDHNCPEWEKPAKAVSRVLKDALYLSETPPEGAWRTFNAWRWKDKELSIADALNRGAGGGGAPGRRYGQNRIDYIYVSNGVRVLSYRNDPSPRPGKKLYPSDHFPAIAKIVLP